MVSFILFGKDFNCVSNIIYISGRHAEIFVSELCVQFIGTHQQIAWKNSQMLYFCSSSQRQAQCPTSQHFRKTGNRIARPSNIGKIGHKSLTAWNPQQSLGVLENASRTHENFTVAQNSMKLCYPSEIPGSRHSRGWSFKGVRRPMKDLSCRGLIAS